MILGVDLGNYATKTSQMISFESKCSKVPGILSNKSVSINSVNYFIEEGQFDTEYRKSRKEYTKALLLYAIQKSTSDIHNKIVVGLPIGQYKKDKDEFREMLLYGSGISDISVYPEGVAAVIGTDYEGVVVDIGGRTTDCCLVTGDKIKKVQNPQSIAKGTLNLYSDFVKALNAKYILELSIEDADRIIKSGLKIFGEPVDVQFAIDGFKDFVDSLVNLLTLEYKLSTQPVLLVGGGAQLLYNPIKRRIPNARLIENSFYANAIGFKRVGCMLWQ